MAGEILQWYRAKPGAAVHIVTEALPNGDRGALCGRRLSAKGEAEEYRRGLYLAVAWGNSDGLYAPCHACTDKQRRIERADAQTETDPHAG